MQNLSLSCADVICQRYLNCLRALTIDEKAFIVDTAMSRLRDTSTVPQAQKAMCASLTAALRERLTANKVFIGKNSYFSNHTANTTSGSIHMDEQYFNDFRTGGIDGQSKMIALFLHEAAHHLSNTTGQYGNHSIPDTQGNYSEYPYSVLKLDNSNPCVKWGT